MLNCEATEHIVQAKPYDAYRFYKRKNILPWHSYDFLKKRNSLGQRWNIYSKIGNGFCCQTFAAYDKFLMRDVGIKVFGDTLTWHQDYSILQTLKPCNYIQDPIAKEVTRGGILMTIIELPGPSMKEIIQFYRPLSLGTIMNVGLQMLRIIETLHSIGYIHCDLKPSMFVTGLPLEDMRNISLYDFSSCRRYKSKDHDFFSPSDVGLNTIGNIKYASPMMHRTFNAGPRDDLWSLLYILLEMAEELPWARAKDDATILNLKIETIDYLTTHYLGEEFLDFKLHLDSLIFPIVPDYNFLRSCFIKLLRREQLRLCAKTEWENDPSKIWELTSPHVQY